jgi:hypothetical protein
LISYNLNVGYRQAELRTYDLDVLRDALS